MEPRCESTGVFLFVADGPRGLAFAAGPVHIPAMSNDNTPPADPGRTGPQPAFAADAAPKGDTGRPCAICGKPSLHAFRPFCSKRCADLDLSRWLNGVYAVPASGPPEDDEEDAAR